MFNSSRAVRSFLLVFLSSVAVAPNAYADAFSMDTSVSYDNSDWMASLPNALRFSDLSIPGTHDSTTFTTSGIAGAGYVKTQTMDLATQFKAGIRFVDIRARFIEADNAMAMHHGKFYLSMNFTDVLNDIVNFLNNHPNEAIFVRLKNECDSKCTGDFAQIFESHMSGAAGSRVWTGAAPNPTLGELRGKIVILDDFLPGTTTTPHAPIAYTATQNPRFKIQDDFNPDRIDDKEDSIAEHFDKTNVGNLSDIYVNFLSAYNASFWAFEGFIAGKPYDFAVDINPWTANYINTSNLSSRTGVVVADFPGKDLINSVISLNITSCGSYPCRKYGEIQNKWHPDHYLNTETGSIQSSTIVQGWTSAQWRFVPVVGTDRVRIQNGWHPDQYLNTENGSIRSSAIDQDWTSAQWKLLPAADPSYVYIQNAWHPDQCLHIENGYIESSPIVPGWWSAQWKLVNY